MGRRDDVDILAHWRRQKRTLKSGKVRKKNFRIDLSFDPPDALIAHTDARQLAREFGDMLSLMAAAQLSRSSKTVSPETVERRERAARPPGNTSRWYARRYSGGRTGHTPPRPQGNNKWGMDSGRLIRTVQVRTRQRSTGEAVATVNVAANRLDPERFGSRAAFIQFVKDLREEVPLLGGKLNATSPAEKRIIKQAMDQIREGLITNLEAKRRRLIRMRKQAIFSAGRQLLGFARSF